MTGTPSCGQQKPPASSQCEVDRGLSSGAMTTYAVAAAAIVAVAGALPAKAEALAPTPVFEGSTTIPAKNGPMEAVHVSVQSWAISRREQQIPLQGFYVAHLLSGQISATIDGQTTPHVAGDYWTVKAGAAMRVSVVGEVAALETIVVSKQ